MKKLPILLFSGTLFAGAMLITQPLHGCGPFLQPSYLKSDSPYNIVYDREEALNRMLKLCDDLIPAKSKLPRGADLPTRKAISHDIAAAVKRYLPDMKEFDQQRIVSSYEHFIDSGRYNFHNFPVLPAELEEFKLYRLGVKELYDSRVPGFVPPSWTKLLQLPPEKRHFRTVWVYFMLGNATKDARYYQLCREAVRAGFADSAGLGRASYYNEFIFASPTMLKKLRVWAEAKKSDPELDLMKDLRYDRAALRKCSEEEYAELLADDLGREFLAVFGDFNRIAFLQSGHNYKFRNADVVAYYYYRNIEIGVAKEWLKRMEKPTLLSLYLEGRIARIEGKRDLAVKKLHDWLTMAKNIDPKDSKSILQRRDAATGDTDSLENDVYGILGNTMVMRRDFVEAAEYFYFANQMESDIATIAECYMSMDELVKFTEFVSKEAPYNGCPDLNPRVESARKIRHLTARRAFRENRMDIAQKYMPREYLPYVEMYLRYLAKSQDKNVSADERALALYNAAKIMRFMGMELCGTEIEPDNFRYEGNYYKYHEPFRCNNCKYDPVFGQWSFCRDGENLFRNEFAPAPGFNAVKNYQNVPWYQRFHYRYTACAMALAAGKMAQDKELKAMIYYFGGEILRKQSPEEADIFYKALVRECRSITLGKLADELRWFPVDNVILRREITNVKPCASVQIAKELMKKAFEPTSEPVKTAE